MAALTDYLTVLEDLRRRGKPGADVALVALETIIDRGRLLADAVTAYETRQATVIAVPFPEVLTTAGLIGAFVAAYIADVDYPPELFLDLRATEAALFDLQTLRRAFASQASATAAAQNVYVPGPAPLVPYRVRQGDTLERMAQQYLGQVDRSWEIVELNSLVYPFLLTTDRDLSHGEFASGQFSGGEFALGGESERRDVPAGVAVPGDLLWLPADAQVPVGLQTFTDLDVELYGRDLLLVDGAPSFSAEGELATVAGVDNMVQALRLRISTFRGELVLHPAYGMEKLLAVGIEGTRANVMISGVGVARTVRQDPRVVDVRDLNILFRETTNLADMRVRLIGAGERTLPLNLVIPETVSTGL